jgi:hypothetical protein
LFTNAPPFSAPALKLKNLVYASGPTGGGAPTNIRASAMGPSIGPGSGVVTISPPVAVNLTEVLFPISQGSLPPEQQWFCDQTEKSGCFDLCQYDPNASPPLVIAQSAVSKFGTVCRDGVPGGSERSGRRRLPRQMPA